MPMFKITVAELISDQRQQSGYSYIVTEEELIVEKPEDVKGYARGLRAMGKANGFGHYVLYAEEITRRKNRTSISFYDDLPDVGKEIYDLSVIQYKPSSR